MLPCTAVCAAWYRCVCCLVQVCVLPGTAVCAAWYSCVCGLRVKGVWVACAVRVGCVTSIGAWAGRLMFVRLTGARCRFVGSSFALHAGHCSSFAHNLRHRVAYMYARFLFTFYTLDDTWVLHGKVPSTEVFP